MEEVQRELGGRDDEKSPCSSNGVDGGKESIFGNIRIGPMHRPFPRFHSLVYSKASIQHRR